MERLVNPETFDNVWLAMWWALQTVTTVGYGDVVPGDTADKVIASFLMLGGSPCTRSSRERSPVPSWRRRRLRGETARRTGHEQAQEITAQLEAIRAELARLDSRTD